MDSRFSSTPANEVEDMIIVSLEENIFTGSVAPSHPYSVLLTLSHRSAESISRKLAALQSIDRAEAEAARDV